MLSDGAHVLYKATDFYHPEYERTILWNDPGLNIDWRVDHPPIVSRKDSLGTAFEDSEKFDSAMNLGAETPEPIETGLTPC